MCVPVCWCATCVWSLQKPFGPQPLGPELQTFVRHSTWVPGSELGSLRRAARTLNHWVISAVLLAFHVFSLYLTLTPVFLLHSLNLSTWILLKRINFLLLHRLVFSCPHVGQFAQSIMKLWVWLLCPSLCGCDLKKKKKPLNESFWLMVSESLAHHGLGPCRASRHQECVVQGCSSFYGWSRNRGWDKKYPEILPRTQLLSFHSLPKECYYLRTSQPFNP